MRWFVLLAFLVTFTASPLAQVTYQRLLQAEKEPGNWADLLGCLQQPPLQ